ncbi:MAG: SAM-dependent chlorinase/fluorinase [Acidobacteriota bacterium]|nr:MAG: SAM-dependent chlorinase/fluorinase [Acidobacteriota bacterium]
MAENDRGAPVIAILTDFGTGDHFVAAVKGAILTIEPSAKIVDITHDIGPHDIRSAGFSLWACYRDFPNGTVFVCVVDPGVGSERKRIVHAAGGYLFVAPDNGLLSFIFDQEEGETWEIEEGEYTSSRISGTFDGRDVFGPVGAHLAGGVPPSSIGKRLADPERRSTGLRPVGFETAGSGLIVHIDRFGNLITNLWPEDLANRHSVEIAGTVITERRKYFGEGGSGGIFVIEGSTGLLEVASNQSSAADALGAGVGDVVSIVAADSRFGQ